MAKLAADRIYWLVLLLAALLGAGLGFYGWWVHDPAPSGAGGFADYSEAIYRSVLLFFGEAPDEKVAPDNYALHVARIVAPLATMGAVLRAILQLLAANIERMRIRGMSGHSIVCGLTEHGAAFALSEVDAGRRVVAIEREPTPSQETLCALHGIRLLKGDVGDRETLRAAAAAKARHIIVTTGDDNRNLEAAAHARALVAETRRSGEPLLAYASVNERQLWRQLAQSDSIGRQGPGFEMRPFNLGVVAARRFFWDEPLYSYADLQGQRRIHAVFVGFDDYAESLIAQLIPCCIYKDFDVPAITVLAPAERDVASRFKKCFPEVDPAAASLSVLSFASPSQPLDDELMAAIETIVPVTAVFVCQDGDDAGLQAALEVKDAMRRHAHWRVPVYVHLRRSDGIQDLMVAPDRARRFADVLQGFGAEDRLCSVELLSGRLETVANDIHEAYQTSRRVELADSADDSREESKSGWYDLRETYREANRRAADHIKAKLASAGCWAPPGLALDAPEGFRLVGSPAQLERLSALEHRSWCAGRRVDGWRPRERRDNERKFHDNLIDDYFQLDESIQQYDRDQIKLIDTAIIHRVEGTGADARLIRGDHWIGVVGKNLVSAEEAGWMRRQLTETVLPKLVERHAGALFTLVTALAPGSDYVLTRATLDFLAGRRQPHRLLLVEAVPEEAMIDDYRAFYDQGASWDGAERPTGQGWQTSADGGNGARADIVAARADMVADDTTDWIIDLTRGNVDYRVERERQAGYRAAASYIADRCDTLIAADRPDGKAKKPGGVAETLDRRAAVQASADELARFRATSVVLDLTDRCIRG